ERPAANHTEVSTGYFGTMRIPLLKGRDFADQDRAGAPLVAAVSETFVRKHFPGENPIGRRIRIGDQTSPPVEIVGVVGDVKFYSLKDTSMAAMYVPFAQSVSSDFSLVLKTAGRAEDAAALLRREVRALDPDLPVTDVRTMDDLLARSVAPQRFNASLLIGFAAMALILAAVGLYGVISYMVTQQTHEFGIRMALGAARGQVLRQVVARAMRLAGAGVVLGVIGALLMTRLLGKLLYGVSATDPVTFVVLAALLAAVALVASYVPARRATKVDPVVALRSE
ncbi:MAG TPA: FtsX-like permease family protein, partial [Gemmatimonadaceae bacterium]|nr:FtsX-like permease family protein [Gemmatimonadaceae bacterium]